MSWRALFAALCGLILYVAIPATYKALISVSPQLYRAYPDLEAILASAIAYALCAVGAWRVEPAWHRYGGPLAVVALAVASGYVIMRSRLVNTASLPL